jgi:hypothetical protein
LQIAFQPQTRTIDVEVTLVADEPPDRDDETSQVWSVPPEGTKRKGRKQPSAFVQVEVTYGL